MPKRTQAVVEEDWNFDAVPDCELAACCYWEYARESAFICGLRERSLRHWLPRFQKPGWWKVLEPADIRQDTTKVRSIGRVARVFLDGFACPPDGVLPDAPPLRPGKVHRLTGSFPKPWQMLRKEEREYRAWSPPKGLVDFVLRVPFERSISLDAKGIIEAVDARQCACDKANERTRKANPRMTEDALRFQGKLRHADRTPSVLYDHGLEHTVVAINWGLFSNEEIIAGFREWVKANRPPNPRPPDGKGRNKARDWRVALERLAMMRLLHRLRLSEMRNACPEAWKLYGRREWYKERKRAGEMFRKLFPFLDRSEHPRSWPTQGGRSR